MMEWLAHRLAPRWIVRHFQMDLPGGSERRLRRHLQHCPDCRALYMVQMLAEGEGRAAAGARHRRLEQALFGPAPARAVRGQRLAWAALAASAAVLLLLLLPPRSGVREKLASSGSDPSSRVSIAVFARTGAGGRFEPVTGSIRRGQPLAFAYSNLSSERFDRLLLFGIDEHHTVYWFYPGWTDERTNPAAYPIAHGRAGVELPDQVVHRYSGTQLRIFGLFTRRRDLTVAEVEKIVRQYSWGQEHFPMPMTGQHSLLLEVRP